MNGTGDNNLELAAMKKLLNSWHVGILYELFRAEKVDVDILQMMKLSHARLLLNNFPLGIQIRFEYNWEQWRKDIGKPLQIVTTNEDSRFQITTTDCNFKTEIVAKDFENKEIQTDLIIYNFNSQLPTNQENIKDTPDVDCSRTTRNSIVSLDEKTNKEKSPEPILPDLPSSALTRSTQHVDLRKILSHATCGIGLINNYVLRKRLSNSERQLLIATIVNYYLENNIEFNVQISYALERAILKMFPSEKLSFYRNTKRGRIYMRYIRAKTAMKQGIGMFNEISSNSLSYKETVNGDVLEQFPASVITGVPPFDEEEIAVNNESLVNSLDISRDFIDNDVEDDTEIKIEPENIHETPHVDSATLIRKMQLRKQFQMNDIDRPFKHFRIPWHKVPYDVIILLENKEELGKGLNVIANLIVDELRKISIHIPVRVLRAVTEQAVLKYPDSFLEKDSKGNLITSTKIPLLSRMRNRNCNLNREK